MYTPKCTHVPIFTTIGPTDFPGSRGRTHGRTDVRRTPSMLLIEAALKISVNC